MKFHKFDQLSVRAFFALLVFLLTLTGCMSAGTSIDAEEVGAGDTISQEELLEQRGAEDAEAEDSEESTEEKRRRTVKRTRIREGSSGSCGGVLGCTAGVIGSMLSVPLGIAAGVMNVVLP